MNRQHLLVLATTLLCAGIAHAGALRLTSPRGGDTTLGCWAHADLKTPSELKPGMAPFLTDERSETSATQPDGSIDVGINGESISLRADRGASLTRGGVYRSTTGPTTVLAVAPGRVLRVHDAHEQEESSLVFRTTFRLEHAGQRRVFSGIVTCAVTDLPFFVKDACPATKAKLGSVCH